MTVQSWHFYSNFPTRQLIQASLFFYGFSFPGWFLFIFFFRHSKQGSEVVVGEIFLFVRWIDSFWQSLGSQLGDCEDGFSVFLVIRKKAETPRDPNLKHFPGVSLNRRLVFGQIAGPLVCVPSLEQRRELCRLLPCSCLVDRSIFGQFGVF